MVGDTVSRLCFLGKEEDRIRGLSWAWEGTVGAEKTGSSCRGLLSFGGGGRTVKGLVGLLTWGERGWANPAGERLWVSGGAWRFWICGVYRVCCW